MENKNTLWFNITRIKKIQEQALETMKKKNNDYARKADNISITGLEGVSVRLIDKAVRCYNLTHSQEEASCKDESLRDTLEDIMNYATIGMRLIETESRETQTK